MERETTCHVHADGFPGSLVLGFDSEGTGALARGGKGTTGGCEPLL